MLTEKYRFLDDRDAETASTRLDQLQLPNGSSLTCKYNPALAVRPLFNLHKIISSDVPKQSTTLVQAKVVTLLRPQALPFRPPSQTPTPSFAPPPPTCMLTPPASTGAHYAPSRTPFSSVANFAANKDANWKPVPAKDRPRTSQAPQARPTRILNSKFTLRLLSHRTPGRLPRPRTRRLSTVA